MAATKDKAKAKGRAVKATAPKPERRDGRYLRAARVIIAEGDGVDLAELAAKAGLSPASSAYCLEAFRGVTQALREAKMLASRPALSSMDAPCIASGSDEFGRNVGLAVIYPALWRGR